MLDLLVTLTTISLIDSLSMLPFMVVALAVLLSHKQPYLTATAFLLGIFLSYLASGVVIALGLGRTINRVTATLVHWFKNPSALDYYFSIFIGLALIFLGYRWSVARRRKAEQKTPDATAGPGKAFLLGAGAVLAGLWGALPYFAAVDTILKEDLSTTQAVAALTYYNVIFIFSGVALVLLRAVLGERANAMFEAVNRFIAVWGKRAVIATMVILGIVMVADGVGWVLGRPLIPVG
jgi:hypothetical protein